MTQTDQNDPGDTATRRAGLASWLMRPEMLVGLSAVLLSLCGLFIALYEASLMRQEQRASVWPHVEVTASINPGSVWLWVQNTGTGPAKLQTAAILYDGEVVQNWRQLIGRLEISTDRMETYQSLIAGRVLPSESERERFYVLSAEENTAEAGLVDSLARAIVDETVDVSVCYCSIYDECWTSLLSELIRRGRGLPGPYGSRAVPDCAGEPLSAI